MKTKELTAIIRAQIVKPRPTMDKSNAKWDKGVWEFALNLVQYRDKDEELNVKTDFLNGHGTVSDYCDERLKSTSVIIVIDTLFCGIDAQMLWADFFDNGKSARERLKSIYHSATAEALRKIKYVLCKVEREGRWSTDML